MSNATKTFYIIREGWNAANQPAISGKRNPKNAFEANRYNLIGIVEASTLDDALLGFADSCYANQSVFAVTNPRSIKGLTQAIRSFERSVC